MSKPRSRASATLRNRSRSDREDDSSRRSFSDDDKLAIREVVENWALWRDAGDWDRFATVWHDDGWMTATWFQGPARTSSTSAARASSKRRQHPALPRRLHLRHRGRPRHLADEDDDQPARRGRRRARGRRLHRALLRLPREARRAAGASCGASRSTRRTGWIRSILGDA